jgi:hypothetical protein
MFKQLNIYRPPRSYEPSGSRTYKPYTVIKMYEPEPLKKINQVRKIVRRSRPPNPRIFQGKGNKFVEPEPKETL